MSTITCRCDTTFEASFSDEIDLDRESSAIDEILEGSFMTITCPNCGERLKPELRLHFHSSLRGIELIVLPEKERFTVYNGATNIADGKEVLIGFRELYERALLLSANLDPPSVEVLKYYILAKALEAENSPDEVLVLFAGRQEDGRLKFHVQGLRDGELAQLLVPIARYEKIKSEFSTITKSEPLSRIFKGSYKSIRTLEFSGD